MAGTVSMQECRLFFSMATLIVGQHRPPAVKLRVGTPEIFYLGHVVERDVRDRRIMNQVVLVIVLRRVKSAQGIHAGDYRPRKCRRALLFADGNLGRALLSCVDVENRGAILPAYMGSLPIE